MRHLLFSAILSDLVKNKIEISNISRINEINSFFLLILKTPLKSSHCVSMCLNNVIYDPAVLII